MGARACRAPCHAGPVPAFRAPDGIELAYHVQGDGRPLACLPGGPMRDSAYLGDLGGLPAVRRLVRLDLRGTPADWAAIAPLRYGRWDAAAQADHAASQEQVSQEAARAFGAPGAFDPPATRGALAGLRAPVLVLAGELDVNTPPELAADAAALFPHARLAVQPGAGHSPWLDDPAWFAAAVTAFLGQAVG